jgi:hypothetical protein
MRSGRYCLVRPPRTLAELYFVLPELAGLSHPLCQPLSACSFLFLRLSSPYVLAPAEAEAAPDCRFCAFFSDEVGAQLGGRLPVVAGPYFAGARKAVGRQGAFAVLQEWHCEEA